MMIKKRSIDKKKCWQNSIVLSQLLILMHIELFPLIIFHLLCSFFYSYFLIFFRFRRSHDFFQNRIMINFIWWFWYDLFQLTNKVKAAQNDEIEVIIADHTHAWAEIRATYGWYSRTEWIFVECKTEETSD